MFTDLAQMKIFALRVPEPGGAAIIFPTSGQDLVPVLSGQKFSSGPTQKSSIVSKTYSKSQGDFVDSFFPVQMKSGTLKKKLSIPLTLN